MSLPKRLAVGHSVYRIEPWQESEARANGRFGETDRLHRVIRIQLAGRQPRDVAETLLHEITHCAYECWNVEKGDGEERTVTALATGLSAIWVQNPDVMRWLAKQFAR